MESKGEWVGERGGEEEGLGGIWGGVTPPPTATRVGERHTEKGL